MDSQKKNHSQSSQTNTALTQVKKELNEKWSKLYSLSDEHDFRIELTDFQAVTDDNLQEYIDDAFRALKMNQVNGIKSLSFDFDNCGQVSNQGFKSLVKLISSKSLKGVETLSLGFFRCGTIQDNFVKDLFTAISDNIKNVRSIYFALSWNQNVGENTLKALAEAMETSAFKNVEYVYLEIYHCKGLNDQGYKSLVDSMKENSKNLKNAKFDFLGCDGIKTSTNKLMEKLGK